MGLDMYLNKKTYLLSNAGPSTIKVPGVKIQAKRVKTITEEVLYWRKANAIHKWFVDNVQNGIDDCREYDVAISQLQQLLAIVEEVLQHPEQAPVLLPTQTGFFFGSYEYDMSYMEDLEYTKKNLEPLIKELLTEMEAGAKSKKAWVYVTYQSSW